MIDTREQFLTIYDMMPIMTPSSQYQLDLDQLQMQPSEEQKNVVSELSRIHRDLTARRIKIETLPWWQFWPTPITPITGLYLWGGVGRGKTYLMDLLYDTLPLKKKMRIHYHAFMQSIHNALAKLPEQANPLKQIASDIAEQTHILCLDELQVLDITDAMLLTQLLQLLHDKHIVIVTTSNLSPDQQYLDGLQRSAFLPTIQLLKTQTSVIHLQGDIDYRKQEAQSFPNYSYPHTAEQQQKLHKEFKHLAGPKSLIPNTTITLQQRLIPVTMQSPHVIWFSFEQICMTARASQDYFELSKLYRYIIISNIPKLSEDSDDACKRFIQLIDALYEEHRWVIITAQTPLDKLYQGQKHQHTFQHTISRLLEMQSQSYLSDCQ